CRVLRPKGRIGFTVWENGGLNQAARIMDEALELYGVRDISLPDGPPYYLYSNAEMCRKAMASAGFDAGTFRFETFAVKWDVPTIGYWFEAERDAGVRTAALLARQTPDRLAKIRKHMEDHTRRFVNGKSFSIPFAAHIVIARKA